MDNFEIQLQSIKSQIDNMKLQIANIEMNFSFRGDQLLNLSIQMLNTGIQTFNLGKNETMLNDNYYEQLKNISNIINSMIEENDNMEQQMMQQQAMQQQMIQQQEMQQQMMQQQIMQQQMMQQIMQQQMMKQQMMQQQFEQEEENQMDFPINVIFDVGPSKRKVTIQCDIETRIKESFEKFSNKIGKSKKNCTCSKDDIKIGLDDVRNIKDIIYDSRKFIVIKAYEK